MRRSRAAGCLAGAVLLAACSPDGSRPAPASATRAAGTPTASGSPATAVPPADPVCRPGPGRTVTDLADVVVPEIVFAGIPGEGPGSPAVAGFAIPAVVVDGGCVVTYDAPAGCAAAVTISAVSIPAATIPATVVPESRAGAANAAARTFAAVTIPGAGAPAVSRPQVCQERTESGLPTVTRAGVVRRAVSRPGATRPGGIRPAVCVGDDCVAAVEIPDIAVRPVKVPDVDIDPVRLRRTRVRAGVDEIEGGEGRAFVAPADVLFAIDEARLTAGASAALAVIAAEVAGGTGTILVEGHTDSTQSEDYNLALSQRRAEAVADWLATRGGLDRERLAVRARGETAPVASNATAAGRALNRRVVISVANP